jgi:hypothetical protein
VCEHNLIGSDLQHPEILSVKLLGNKKIYLRNYIILIDVSIDIDFSIKVNLDCVLQRLFDFNGEVVEMQSSLRSKRRSLT